jgi:O-antigen/teichoic acid export membrane protein
MKRRLPAISGQAAWGLGDQIFSSATNFGVNVLIARSLGASSFGAFSVAFATYVLILNVSRAVNTEPLAIRFSAAPESSWRVGAARSSAATLAMGVLGSLACAVVAMVTSGDLRASFLALVVTLPGLLYADLWRFAFFAAGHGHRAMITDVLWAVVMFPAVIWLLGSPEPSLFAIALAWAGSAVVAGLVVAVLWGVAPAFTEIGIWLREHRDLTPAFVGELAAVSGAVQVALIGMGIVANLAAVGAYRAAYVLFGPLRVVYQGMTLFGVPAAVRALGQSPQHLRAGTRRGALFLATIALAYGAVLMLMPSEWGEFILGETWPVVEPLIVPFTIGILAIGLDTPTYIGLRALEAAGTAFRTRLVVAAADVTATIAGAAFGGAVGAAWAGKTAQLLGTGLWWRAYWTRLAEREAWPAQLAESPSK